MTAAAHWPSHRGNSNFFPSKPVCGAHPFFSSIRKTCHVWPMHASFCTSVRITLHLSPNGSERTRWDPSTCKELRKDLVHPAWLRSFQCFLGVRTAHRKDAPWPSQSRRFRVFIALRLEHYVPTCLSISCHPTVMLVSCVKKLLKLGEICTCDDPKGEPNPFSSSRIQDAAYSLGQPHNIAAHFAMLTFFESHATI